MIDFGVATRGNARENDSLGMTDLDSWL